MPKKYFVIELAAGIEIHVYIETFNGLVISYVVKLLLRDGKKYYEVIRFDSAHGCPHKDTIDEKGEVIEKHGSNFSTTNRDWICQSRISRTILSFTLRGLKNGYNGKKDARGRSCRNA